ncbi:MAG: YccF domain-containing protein [Bacteroidales bacterium]|nr:YccF domain-containing protein [Bacteroidales bacterium]
MRLLGNIIWLLCGGLITAMEYLVASLVLLITIIGIPFALQTIKLAMLELWPFGAEIKTRENQPGCLSTLMNFIWLFVGGFWIFLTHLVFGFLLGITIIGIPFAKQHFKLAHLALTPFGREVIF